MRAFSCFLCAFLVFGMAYGQSPEKEKNHFWDYYIIDLDQRAGNYENLHSAIKVGLKRKGFRSETRLWRRSGENYFPMSELFTLGPQVLNTANSELLQHGFRQSFYYRNNKAQSIEAGVKYGLTDRWVPPTDRNNYDAWQNDDALRIYARAGTAYRKGRTDVNYSFLQDDLQNEFYLNALPIPSRSRLARIRTHDINQDSYYNWAFRRASRRISLKANLGFDEVAPLDTTAMTRNRFGFQLESRRGIRRVGTFTYGIGRKWVGDESSTWLPKVVWRFNVGRRWRTPIFNFTQRFYKDFQAQSISAFGWQATTFAGLNSASSWNYEFEAGLRRYKLKANRIYLRPRFEAWRKRTDNYLVWQPGPDLNWTPTIVPRVLSKGYEMGLELDLNPKGWRIKVEGASRRNIARVVTAADPSDGSEGKQVMMTPSYDLSAKASIQKGSWGLSYSHRWQDMRNVSPDGQIFFREFDVGSAELSRSFWFRSLGIELGAEARNIYNEEYAQAWWWMPTRMYLGKVTFHFQKINKEL